MKIKDYIIFHAEGNLYWKDKNLKYLGCNANFSKIAHLNTPEDIVGKTDKELFSDYLSAEEIQELNDIDLHVIHEDAEITCEETGVNEHGEKRIFLTKKTPLRNQRNTIIGVIGTSLEITEHKKI